MKLRQRLLLTFLILIAAGLISVFIYNLLFNSDNIVNATFNSNIITSNQVSVSVRNVDNITSNFNNTNSTTVFNDGAPLGDLTDLAPNDLAGAEVLLDSPAPASLKSKADSLRQRVEAEMKAILESQGPVDPNHVPTTKEEALLRSAALERMPKTPDLVASKTLTGTEVAVQWGTSSPIRQTADVTSSVRLTPTQSPNPWGIYSRTQQILAETYADQSAGLAGSSLPTNLQSAASPSSSGLQLQGMDPLGVQAQVQASPVLSGLGLKPESFATQTVGAGPSIQGGEAAITPSGPKYFPSKGSEAFGVDVQAPSSSVLDELGKGKSRLDRGNPTPLAQQPVDGGLGSPASTNSIGSEVSIDYSSPKVEFYPGVREDIKAYITQGEPSLFKVFERDTFKDENIYQIIQRAEKIRYYKYTGLYPPRTVHSSRVLIHALIRSSSPD